MSRGRRRRARKNPLSKDEKLVVYGGVGLIALAGALYYFTKPAASPTTSVTVTTPGGTSTTGA